MKDNHSNLVIACKHVANSQRKGIKRGSDVMCAECWSVLESLHRQYGENIPIEKLDFAISVCKVCLNNAIKKYKGLN